MIRDVTVFYKNRAGVENASSRKGPPTLGQDFRGLFHINDKAALPARDLFERPVVFFCETKRRSGQDSLAWRKTVSRQIDPSGGPYGLVRRSFMMRMVPEKRRSRDYFFGNACRELSESFLTTSLAGFFATSA
jgi:hypothetical protein